MRRGHCRRGQRLLRKNEAHAQRFSHATEQAGSAIDGGLRLQKPLRSGWIFLETGDGRRIRPSRLIRRSHAVAPVAPTVSPAIDVTQPTKQLMLTLTTTKPRMMLAVKLQTVTQ